MFLQRGFNLIETVSVVAVVGVLATIAAPTYSKHIAKTQVSEAIASMESQKSEVLTSLVKNGTCIHKEGNAASDLKYGKLTISGTVKRESITNSDVQLKTGCTLTYTFGNEASTRIQGKKLVVDVFNNGILSKNSNTNLIAEQVPRSLTVANEDAITKTIVIGSPEVAKDTQGIVETPPASNIIERDITSLIDTAGKAVESYAGKTYTVVRGVDLLDMFEDEFKRKPKVDEIFKLTVPDKIALVGNVSVPEGLLIPSAWPNGAKVEIINKGLILGLGGQGNGSHYANGQPTVDGTNGSTGIKNLSSASVKVENYGGIAGGGGGGARGSNQLQGGGGAPYGIKGVITGITYYPPIPATNAGFAQPGVGAEDPKNSSRGGGAGGGFGEDGKTVIVTKWMNYYGNQYGTLAGLKTEGAVTIIDRGGWVKGRDK